MGELQHVARMDPLISTENHDEELKKAECFACWKPLLDSVYLSPNCGFFLHTKCVDLSVEVNHPIHPQHHLLLQFNSESLFCNICQNTRQRRFSYCCPPCNFLLHIDCAAMPTKVENHFHLEHPLSLQFVNESLPCLLCKATENTEPVYFCSICKIVLHIECESLPSIIEDKTHHEHPFVLFHRQVSFTCNACGTSGNYVPYFCLACGFVVHKKCISLPDAIKFYRHHHPLSHNYFHENDEIEMLECGVCRELVKTEYGSYFCSKCKYIVHVKCALKGSYSEVDPTKTDETDAAMYMKPYSRVTDTSINHFSHHHDLEFSEDIKDEKQCDGCVLFISTSYYYCSQCDFFLHKSCAELSLKKHLWFHYCHQSLLELISDGIFECSFCERETSGFGYNCDECEEHYCLRCAIVSDIHKHEGHEHPLSYFHRFDEVPCDACGSTTRTLYRCKRCNFNVHGRCLKQPLVVKHKSDLHPLKLICGDNNDYSEYHYCDVCEEKRNPNHWFYYYAICDTATHPDCVIGKDSYIKSGSIYTKGNHSHPLTFARNVYFYPKCRECHKLCLSLALECKENGCGYIVHWKCPS